MGSSWKMTSSLILCFSIFAFFSPSSPSRILPSSDSQKVSVGVYYESLCPYSANFIVNYLVKLFEDDLISIVDLKLVPWGNAKLRANNTFACQDGHFPFIYCVEALVLEHKYPEWESCFQKLDLDPKPIEKCYTSKYGEEAGGKRKHLKRLKAPKHWMLDKLGGAFAPKPSPGPHKLRECLPLILILRNKLKYALRYREVIFILMQRHVLVDGKVRTDHKYPAGFMDVVSIPKTNENFRLLYDVKGRFRLRSITEDEAQFKLCKVRSVHFGKKGIPYLNTYDGRTMRYPDPLIKANDTIKIDLDTYKITDFIKFEVGNVAMVTGGRNRGRVGIITRREKHVGSFDTIHVQDAVGNEFATRLENVFIIGRGSKPWVTLPKGKGIKLSIIEEARLRREAERASAA